MAAAVVEALGAETGGGQKCRIESGLVEADVRGGGRSRTTKICIRIMGGGSVKEASLPSLRTATYQR